MGRRPLFFGLRIAARMGPTTRGAGAGGRYATRHAS